MKLELQSLLNDNYLWVSNSILLFENIDIEALEFEVPKTRDFRELRIVKRNEEAALNTLNQIKDKHIYYSAITYICALVEDFLIKIQKLLCTDWKFFKSELKEEVVCDKIDDLKSLKKFDLRKYCEVLKIDYEIECWDFWQEIKATRNIIVHNKGIVNKKYLKHAGVKERGILNQEILIDREYFMLCISILKSVVGKVENFLKNKCMKK